MIEIPDSAETAAAILSDDAGHASAPHGHSGALGYAYGSGLETSYGVTVDGNARSQSSERRQVMADGGWDSKDGIPGAVGTSRVAIE